MKQIIVIAIISFLLGASTIYLTRSPIVIDDSELKELKTNYERIKNRYELLLASQDSIIQQKERVWKEIINDKNKTIENYEGKIKDMSDVSIVSNDSITNFIASRLRNR